MKTILVYFTRLELLYAADHIVCEGLEVIYIRVSPTGRGSAAILAAAGLDAGVVLLLSGLGEFAGRGEEEYHSQDEKRDGQEHELKMEARYFRTGNAGIEPEMRENLTGSSRTNRK